MKRKMILSTFLGICFVVLIVSGCTPKKSDVYLGVEKALIDTQLTHLLHNYYPRIIDTVNGGYWTNFENDWTLSKEQNKMLVTQARGLWAAARASELFPDVAIYREAADHGFKFLTEHLWDSIDGGFCQYYFTDSAKKTDPSYKLTYGNAFALYGLSQYAKINKDPQVLAWVRKSFDWIESAMHDSVYGGYYNLYIAEKIKKSKSPESRNLIRAYWGNPDWKDQNSSIHLMEAFTTAYQVLPEQKIKDRLKEMLELVRDTMTSNEGYLRLYYTRTWQPISNRDSSRAYIMENLAVDHISFGHNIETAYLLVDASQALYGKTDSLTLAIAKKLIDHTIAHGFDKDFYGICDKGYQFSDDSAVVILDSTKVWWAQAEAWHALALFSNLYPLESKYAEGFEKMWGYINKEIIDPQYGGWYNSGRDKNPETTKERKVHEWKGCYHDGRALMQVLTYASQKMARK
jgi:cellobiose epimerase